MPDVDFASVTELAGDEVSREQIERLCHRYYWAGSFCNDRDVLEIACGTGIGLGYLAGIARNFWAGDYAESILRIAQRHYGKRIALAQFDAQQLPFRDRCLDVVVLFEAIYYLPAAERFVRECRRVLRPGGKILIATANKDLYDFNPSPHSVRYYGVSELRDVVSQHGFEAEFFGDAPITAMALRQKLLRPLKRIAVALGALPKTMEGKKALRRLVFGRLTRMPLELKPGLMAIPQLNSLPPDAPDSKHKIIFCAATLPSLSPDSRCIAEGT